MGNLLDNARKWSPPGQSVVGRAATRAPWWCTTTARASPRRTCPTSSTASTAPPAARGLPGSGLGLAIVAQVVKAEGGTILAENDPAGGARMSMRLPTMPAADGSSEQP